MHQTRQKAVPIKIQRKHVDVKNKFYNQVIILKKGNKHTLRNMAVPCEIIQSRSISPKRNPPSRLRPSTGCLVRICTGPLARELIKITHLVELQTLSKHSQLLYSLNLVVYHMLETLIIGRAQKYLGRELATRVSIVHDFEASGLVTLLPETSRDCFDSHVCERCRITLTTC